MTDAMRDGRWRLSAPESSVLLWGPETRDREVLKLALLELVVRKALRLVSVQERRLYFWTKRTNVLTVDPPVARRPSRSLQAVIDAHPRLFSYSNGTFGAPIEAWARAVFERYRQRGGYVQAEVLPALEERGFFTREQSMRLGMFASTQWMITPAGESASEELSGLLDTGRVLFGLNTTGSGAAREAPDPAQVRAYVDAAGAALLLLRGHYPEIRRQLGRASGRRIGGNHERHVDGPIVVFVGGELWWPEDEARVAPSEPTDADAGPLEIDDLAENLGPEPFDGIDGAYDAIDAGVDSGEGGDGDGGE